jgi:hypothetical protein
MVDPLNIFSTLDRPNRLLRTLKISIEKSKVGYVFQIGLFDYCRAEIFDFG